MATRRARYPGVRFRGDVVYYRVKLASGLTWDLPEASTASVGIAHPTN